MSHRVLSLLVVLGLSTFTAFAQETPAQAPAVPVAPNFRRLNFDVGGGMGIGKGDVGRLVGASYNGVAGVGMNFSRMFGFNAEYLYYGLPIKESVIKSQFLLPGAGGRVQAFSLNGIVNGPRLGRWTPYGIFGVGFYQRIVSNSNEKVLKGALCQPAWRWWDLTCTTGPGTPVLALDQTIGSNTKDAGGFNAGGGFAYRLNHLHRASLYFEGRYHRAYHSDEQTSFLPITIGLRW